MDADLVPVLLVLAAGLSPLVLAALRDRTGRTRAVAVTVIVLALAGFALGAAVIHSRPPKPPPPLGVPDVLPEEGYVGSDACRSCHPSEHATWHASYHRTMTQMASPESVIAPFDGTELELEGVTWRLDRRGDEFFVHGKEGATEVDVRVVMTTGSHNYQLYWLESDGQTGLHQFPLIYLRSDRIWIPRKSRFLQPPIERTPDETGRWKAHCVRCHATRGVKEDPQTGRPRAVELGIACEACHGPGGKHVAANRMPFRRYAHHLSGEPDPTIVNPRRLPHDRATDVCGQCHGIEVFLDQEKATDWARHGARYRPGDELLASQTTVAGRYEDNPPEVREYLDHSPTFRLKYCFWSDGSLRVTGREYHGMLESPCYQRGRMSCLSCHRLHRSDDDARSLTAWAEDQLDEGMRGDHACIQCHERFADATEVAAHSHHPAESTGSRCYNCHMPFTTWGLLRAIRSHTVQSPSVSAGLTTGRPNACNQCHLDQTLDWTARNLSEWYGVQPPELSADEKETAASILWTLRGDPGQRALMAWSMGWQAAREASGSDWMVPLLTALMMDPYHAVRFRAQRSLGAYEEFADITADSVTGATKAEQRRMVKEILTHWEQTFPTASERREPRLLLRPDGTMDPVRFRYLTEQRDDEPLVLFE